MELFGRDNEVKELERLYQSGKSEFVAIYGRRRIGKTFLVSQVFHDRMTFSHAGLSPLEMEEASQDVQLTNQIKLQLQLHAFYNALLRAGYRADKVPDNWLDAFLDLELFLQAKTTQGKQVIFLDELPWMDTPDSHFLSAFENFWNGWASFRNDILLIVCGSATSWMMKKIVNGHGGLYGRLSEEIHLLPFHLGQTEAYLKSRKIRFSRYDIAQTYMVFGGVPYYLSLLRPDDSLPKNIDALFFERNAKLKEEYYRLFSSNFDHPDEIRAVVELLNQRKAGYQRPEIAASLGIKDGSMLSQCLTALTESDMVIRYFPFGGDKRKPYYKLVDSFCLFYLRFVKDSDSLNEHFFEQRMVDPRVNAWRGLAFENLCFQHIGEIKRALSIGGVKSEESGFFIKGNEKQEGAQVDLIIKRADNIVDVCEAKFYSDIYVMDKEAHLALVRRENAVGECLSRKEVIQHVLLTTYGLKENEYSDDYSSVLTLDDLF